MTFKTTVEITPDQLKEIITQFFAGEGKKVVSVTFDTQEFHDERNDFKTVNFNGCKAVIIDDPKRDYGNDK